MKNYFKTLASILGALILVLSFQNCKKVTINGKDYFLPDDPILKYETKFKKINYSFGGWYGPRPNYESNLKLETNIDGKVIADLKYVKRSNTSNTTQAKECTAKGYVSAQDYANLEKSILESETKKHCENSNSCAVMIDGGSKYITTTNQKDLTTLYHLRDRNDLMKKGDLIFTNPEFIQKAIDNIIEKLKLVSDCESLTADLNFKKISFSQDEGYADSSNHPEELKKRPFPQTFQKLSWTVEPVGGSLLLSGVSEEKTFSSAYRYTTLRKQFANIKLSSDIVDSAKKLTIIKSGPVCMIAYVMPVINGKSPELVFTNLNGLQDKAGFGCHNSPRVQDEKDFVGKIKSLIANMKK